MNALNIQAEFGLDELRFTLGETWLGQVLVAMSDRGVAAILIGDEAGRLRRDLTTAFPHARLTPNEAGLRDALAKVIALIETPGAGLDLPLDLQGGELEQAVWAALRTIPAGETTTYGQIAKALPIPATAQEVGAACAANVLAVAVPCHRVLKADGSISGYRWGVGRKVRLLKREAQA